jgi:hypothetical protein
LVNKILPLFLDSQARIFRDLNDDERAGLVALLGRVADPQA